MAKKKRRKEEEKAIFKRPDFDEKDYMRKEMLNAKVGIITFFYALPYAIVSWQLTLANLSIFGFLAVIIGIISLRYVYPYFKIDVEEFEKKTWLGNGAVLVLTWLSIWVLLLNPPFSDLARPDITGVQVSGDGAFWTNVTRLDEVTVQLQGSPGVLAIKARVTDNVGIRNMSIKAADRIEENVRPWGVEKSTFGHVFDDMNPGIVEITIRSHDESGNVAEIHFNIRLTN